MDPYLTRLLDPPSPIRHYGIDALENQILKMMFNREYVPVDEKNEESEEAEAGGENKAGEEECVTAVGNTEEEQGMGEKEADVHAAATEAYDYPQGQKEDATEEKEGYKNKGAQDEKITDDVYAADEAEAIVDGGASGAKEEVLQNPTAADIYAQGEQQDANEEKIADKKNESQEQKNPEDVYAADEKKVIVEGEVNEDKEELMQNVTAADGYAKVGDEEATDGDAGTGNIAESQTQATAEGNVYAADKKDAVVEGTADKDKEVLMQNITRDERIARMVLPGLGQFVANTRVGYGAHIDWDD